MLHPIHRIELPIMPDSDVNVIDEQIITYPTAYMTRKGFHGEARIMVTVEIEGEKYYAEKVVSLSFGPVPEPQVAS